MIRFIVRRDRLLIAGWVAVAVAVPVFNAFSLGALLPTEAARLTFAEVSAGNPLTAALLGPLDDTSIEGVVFWRSSVQSKIILGLGGLLFAIRHTRAEEDSGRWELMAAGAVRRHAAVTAAMVVVAAVTAAVTVLLAAALVLLFGYSLGGSVLFGLAAGASGLMFAACGLVAGQLAQSAPLARGAAVGVLVPRVAQWWVPLVVAALLLVVAYVVAGRRDLGAGLLRDRSGTGPARGGPASPVALAWRLYGGQVVSWTIALGVMSAGAGWVSVSRLGELGWGDVLAIFTYVFCLVVACLTAAGALRPYTEERRGRVAPLLVSTSRSRWLSGYVVLGLAAPVAMLLAVGAGTGLGSGALLAQMGKALLFVPAAWTVAGVALAVYGLRPRLAIPAAWATVGVSTAFVALWEAQTIGRTAFLFTPYGYGHPLISAGYAAPIAFTLVAAVLVGIGWAAFARRDLVA
ncbi:ABC-2 type transport system permease protein [Nonomuraea solani]|uniref:ABC-2 type transport system permease protein n=1 Tax=Nonomuraea solani TaxID=1144553 RepID=A0A1H6EMQ8_9ACTN|nr:hypothetical protein [Nonomuraea solani]SEG98069.1 ABC-2 type transport system permease protein [Nonomuraea solani]